MTVARRLNLAAMTVSGTPGTGAITLLAASGNYQTFGSAATNAGAALAIGDIIWCKAVDDTAWQIWPASVTNATGPVLAAPDSTVRGFSSSTGSVLSLTSAAIVSAEQPQEDMAQNVFPPTGSLTFVSGTPVMVSDQVAQSTIYHTAGVVALYNGSSWIAYVTPELTMALNTSNHLLNNVYDLFIFNNAGVISIGAGPAWTASATITVTIATPAVVSWGAHGLSEGDPVVFTTSGALPTGITAGTTYFVGRSPAAGTFNISTTVANAATGTFVNTTGSQSGTHTGTNHTRSRGTGAGTTEQQSTNGLPTNKNSITLTNGAGAGVSGVAAGTGLFVGSFFCTANGQSGVAFNPSAAAGGSAPIIGLYRAYNRVLINVQLLDSTASWTVSSTTPQALDQSTGNRISFLDGQSQLFTTIEASFYCSTTTGGNVSRLGASLNATNATPTPVANGMNNWVSSAQGNALGKWRSGPVLGMNYWQLQQYVSGATSTFTYSLYNGLLTAMF